jgi:hypothetical protein
MKKKTLLISTLIASTVLLALAPQGRQIAQEAPLQETPLQETPLQETPLFSLFLLRRPCVDTGIGNWARRSEDVSVGRAVYTSRFFMGPGNRSAALTCKLQPNSANVIFQRMNLSFGMRDNDQGSPPVNVNVYLDGQRAETRTVAPGQPASITLDVTPTSNVAIEAICSSQSQYCDRVYFWDAELKYPPSQK